MDVDVGTFLPTLDPEWVDVVRIRRSGALVMEWVVEGRDSELPLQAKLEGTPVWEGFLRWLAGIPPDEWHEILIDHTLTHHDITDKA